MTIGQVQTENKIYSDIRNYASESTPLNRFKKEMESAYGKDRFWQVMEELSDKKEIAIHTVKDGRRLPCKVLVLLKADRNVSAYSLAILNGQEMQRIVIGKGTAVSDIANLVCTYFNVNEDTLHNKSRKRELVKVRQTCMYFQYKYSSMNLTDIGKYWDRDHSTVIHGKQTVQDLYDTDKRFKADFDQIKRLIISKL